MIHYRNRTRDYYAAQGYAPYTWAHFDQTPFTALQKPLAESRIVLLTTAAPDQPALRLAPDTGPEAKYNAALKFFAVYTAPINPKPDLRISHIGYDRAHCAATDSGTWLPIDALVEAQTAGELGEIAEKLIGVPTNRSQRITLEQDAPAAFLAAQNLAADVAILVPS